MWILKTSQFLTYYVYFYNDKNSEKENTEAIEVSKKFGVVKGSYIVL